MFHSHFVEVNTTIQTFVFDLVVRLKRHSSGLYINNRSRNNILALFSQGSTKRIYRHCLSCVEIIQLGV